MASTLLFFGFHKYLASGMTGKIYLVSEVVTLGVREPPETHALVVVERTAHGLSSNPEHLYTCLLIPHNRSYSDTTELHNVTDRVSSAILPSLPPFLIPSLSSPPSPLISDIMCII